MFAIACLVSFVNAYAYNSGFQSVVGVKLPALGGEIRPYTIKKEKMGPQYYVSTGTIDSLTAKYADVKVKLESALGTTKPLVLAFDEHDCWDEDKAIFDGFDYTIVIRRNKSSITTATHSGSWYLDDRFGIWA